MGNNLRLWNTKVVYELVVLAGTSSRARFLAKEAVKDASYDNEPFTTEPEEIRDSIDLPASWDDHCIPWGERMSPDMTIEQILAEQEAERQKELRRQRDERETPALPGLG